MKRIQVLITAVMLLSSCSKPSPSSTSPHLQTLKIAAAGDGTTNDTAALQAMVDAAAGGPVFLPDGVYLLGKGSGSWSLSLPAHTRLYGQSRSGTILRAAPGIPSGIGFRVLDVAGAGVTVATLTIDGNKGAQTVDEHRHGLLTLFSGTTVDGVLSTNNTGDGVYAYFGADHFTLRNSELTANNRNGATLSGKWDHGLIEDNLIHDNRAQDLDSEASVLTDLTIRRNTITHAGATDHLFTISGKSPANGDRSSGWNVYDNRIDGGTHLGWVDDIYFHDNVCVSDSRPCVSVYRTNNRIQIEHNQLTFTRTVAPPTDLDAGAVVLSGSAEGGPSRVLVKSNRISVPAGSWSRAFGVRMQGIVSAFIDDNDITGPGEPEPYSSAIWVRATDVDRDIESVIVRGNRIRDFGAYGVSVNGNGAALLRRLVITGNLFDDSAGSMRTAVSLDDGSGALVSVRMADNDIAGGCGVPVAHVPVGMPAPSF